MGIIYKSIVIVLLAWGIVSATAYVIKPVSKLVIPEVKVEKAHYVYNDLFTILDSKESEWFYADN
jgi:hypothetical protein